MAGILALGLVWICLDPFNNLTRKHLYLDFASPMFWVYILGFISCTGLLMRSYPAFPPAWFRPVQVLKGTFKKVNALVTPRKILVVFQFTIAIALIICTFIVLKQLRYAQARENGYDKDNLVYVMLQGDAQKNITLIKNELRDKGVITSASMTSSPIVQSWSNTWGINWQGKPPGDKTIINSYTTDGNLVKTMGMHIVEGRDIDLLNYPTDTTAVILNESAVTAMRFKAPLGQVIGYPQSTQYHVIGVVKDFIIESPIEPIRPMVMWGPADRYFNTVHFKLNPAHSTRDNLAAMEKVFKKYSRNIPSITTSWTRSMRASSATETTTAGCWQERRSVDDLYFLPRALWAGGLHGRGPGQGNRGTQGAGGLCHQPDDPFVQRFHRTGTDLHRLCHTAGLVFHEQMAHGLQIPHPHRLLDLLGSGRTSDRDLHPDRKLQTIKAAMEPVWPAQVMDDRQAA